MPQPHSTEALARYHALNESFGRPQVLHLSKRGFFSEVNVAMAAVIRALVQRRRLMVTQNRFNGLRWGWFFDSELPSGDPASIAAVAAEEHVHRAKDQSFADLIVWARAQVDRELRIEELAIEGSPTEVKRQVCALFCQPAPAIAAEVEAQMRGLGLREGAFQALHVRRGDKLQPRERNGKIRPSEGEDAPIGRCLELLAEVAPATRELFVLTDDYRVIEELRVLAPGLRVTSLCPPSAVGHHQADFNRSASEAKLATVNRLVVEVNIAARSAAFAGGFKSNIPRFITSIHRLPDRCVSTDSSVDAWNL